VPSPATSETTAVIDEADDPVPGTSTDTAVAGPSTSTCPVKKRRRSDQESSAVDKTLSAMSEYFSSRTKSTTQPTDKPNEEIDFGRFVAAEVSKIKNVAVRSELKRTVCNAIFDAQVQDDACQAAVQYVVLQAGDIQTPMQ
jgi:hypothetical protein